MNYSKYQEDIFTWIRSGSGHAVVMARAGSGKTFTIEHALKVIDPDESVLFLAFNKHIAEELRRRVSHPMVEVSTLNSFGWRICRSEVPGVKLSVKKTQFALKEVVPEWKERVRIQGCVSRLISLRKATMCSEYSELAAKFDVDLREDFDFSVLDRVWDLISSNTAQMDFDDQIFMPVEYGWAVPKYDWVFVDEAQDLSPVQIELVAEAGSRIVAVGDNRQAIYGFRGADPYAIDNIVAKLSPTILPLSICYRCPSAVLDEARKIVPDIQDAPGCAEGLVRRVKKLDAVSGDYVLCRTTAPLVGECLKMIGAGKKAMVKGRDIGRGLLKLMKQVGLDLELLDFIEILGMVHEAEVARLERMGRDSASIDDKVACISILSSGCSVVAEIVDKIHLIFSDQDVGVVFCTVHRAKGLEADNIWIIRPDLMPFPKAKLAWQREQEMNLKYVAITRAQETLTYVS